MHILLSGEWIISELTPSINQFYVQIKMKDIFKTNKENKNIGIDKRTDKIPVDRLFLTELTKENFPMNSLN
jgi:hypothetical protein